MATAFQPKQQREAEGREGTTLHRTYAQRRGEQDVARQAETMGEAAATSAVATQNVTKRLTGPRANETRKMVQAARRSMRAPAARPKRERRPVPISAAEELAASRKAAAMWDRAEPVQAHPYLTRKGIESHGLRRDRRNNLLVPMRDIDGRLWGVQTIAPDGSKLFTRNGRKQGVHALLGELEPGAPVVIAEGFATAATMREATGLPVAVAFDSGNLLDVARAFHERDPQRTIIIAADNDHHLPLREAPLPNVGQEKARTAAAAVRGVVLTPGFAPTDRGTDWNDYAAQHGRAAMRSEVQAQMRARGVEPPGRDQKTMMTQAQRDAGRMRPRQGPTSSPTDYARRIPTMRPRRPTL